MSANDPIFVIGPERSGANLLAWSLGQHPALTTGLSTRWLGPFVSDLDRAFDQATVDDRAQLGNAPVTRESFLGTFGEAALGLLGGSAAEGGRSRMVDATPDHAFQVFALRRLFPDARFIHVVRDVSSVVRLLLDKDISKLFRTYHREQKAYEHWLSTVRACLGAERALGSDTFLRILHRDLVADPERILRRCLDFIGEDWHPACLRPLDGIEVDGETSGADGNDGAVVPFQEEAEALSRSLLGAPAPPCRPDPALIEELERAAVQTIDRRSAPSSIRALVTQVRSTMEAVMPAGSRALVVSRGDDELLEMRGRTAAHFPQDDSGQYLGYHPADSADAIARLEALRQGDAQFLVIPSTSFWWLDHYRDFRRHLDEHYPVVAHQQDVCVVYSLDPRARVGLDLRPPAPESADQPASLESLSLRLQQLESELPLLRSQLAMAPAAVATDGRSDR